MANSVTIFFMPQSCVQMGFFVVTNMVNSTWAKIYLIWAIIVQFCLISTTCLAQNSKLMAHTSTQSQIVVSNMVFDCRTAGPSSGVAVILLHGWPETSHMWLPLMDSLAAQGFRCLAPNQRGFSAGARPTEVLAYQINHLADDVIALADAAGIEHFHLIGHDWGAAIGWVVAAKYPNRLLTWTAMSVPHPQAFAHAIRHNPQQRKMSRYMGWFQWRGLSEWFLLRANAKALRDVWRKSSTEQVEDYMRVLGSKNALRASLNYYRANYKLLKKGNEVEQIGKVQVPTLMLWGKRDFALGRWGVEQCGQFVSGPYRLVELEATHWLVQEAFIDVEREVLIHVK